MRMMLKFRFPVESGNEVLRTGKVVKVLEGLTAALKPEAAYFYPDEGQRAGLFVFDMQDSAQVVAVLEPLFFGLNAHVDLTPVMTAEDLQKGFGGLEAIIKTYG